MSLLKVFVKILVIKNGRRNEIRINKKKNIFNVEESIGNFEGPGKSIDYEED